MPRVSQPLAQLLFSKTGWHAMYNAAHTQRSVTLPRVALESMGKHKGFLYVAAAGAISGCAYCSTAPAHTCMHCNWRLPKNNRHSGVPRGRLFRQTAASKKAALHCALGHSAGRCHCVAVVRWL